MDQFGVLHDGKQPYPGAISTLENIAKTGGKMVIISNSSRRSSVTIEKVQTLGFDSSLFLGAITSGELTHQYLQRLYYIYTTQTVFINYLAKTNYAFSLCISNRRDDPWFASLGRSCIHFTWSGRGAISLEVCGAAMHFSFNYDIQLLLP